MLFGVRHTQREGWVALREAGASATGSPTRENRSDYRREPLLNIRHGGVKRVASRSLGVLSRVLLLGVGARGGIVIASLRRGRLPAQHPCDMARDGLGAHRRVMLVAQPPLARLRQLRARGAGRRLVAAQLDLAALLREVDGARRGAYACY